MIKFTFWKTSSRFTMTENRRGKTGEGETIWLQSSGKGWKWPLPREWQWGQEERVGGQERLGGGPGD